MDEQKINVLYTFDTRFCKLASVAMYAMLAAQNPNTKCNLYCMVAPHTRGRRKIQRIVNNFPNARLIWRVVRKSENPFQSYDFSRWSPVIFYRLIACNIFPDVEKMLYMDSDTLVRGDLCELFNTDISDYAMGAITDIAPIDNPDNPNGVYVREFSEKHLDGGLYFNSGVLLLNMTTMKSRIAKLTSTKVPLKYPDQDLLNAALCGEILPLPQKYNTVPGFDIPPHIPEHLVPKPDEEPVIWHFYAAKPYLYQYVPRNAYSAFFRAASALNMYPDDFLKDEIKHSRRNARKRAKTNPDADETKKLYPYLTVTGVEIKFLWITLARALY